MSPYRCERTTARYAAAGAERPAGRGPAGQGRPCPAAAQAATTLGEAPMSTHFLSDEPSYAFCPAGDSHDGPFQIRIAVEDMAVSIPTSLVAPSLDDAFT